MRIDWLLTFSLSALFLTLGDHYTTWVCLQETVPGWEVTEVNPIAAWLFGAVGLVPGLLIDTVVTVIALVWLHNSEFPRKLKFGFLWAVMLVTAYAVANNAEAISRMGL